MRNRTLAAIGTALILALGSVVAITAPAAAANTTYYVDAVSGSDSASGTSTATAWRTLPKVNSVTFGAGDRILFMRGQTWTGQLHPLGSGAAGNSAQIGAYGSGALPTIDGGGLTGGVGTGAAVYLLNQQYWTIDSLHVINDSGTDNLGGLDESTWGLHRDGILVRATTGSVYNGITISNNVVEDVNGCFNCQGLDGHGNGGILVLAEGASNNFAGVNIVGNTVDNVGRTGIGVFDVSYYDSDQTVLNPTKLTSGVVVQNNTVTNTDSDGILVFGTEGAVLQYNIVGNAGQETIVGSTTAASAGLWPTRALDTTVQFNEVYGTQTHDTDGQGFDVDLLSVNTKVQYNYSHDNEGGFLLMMGGYSSNLVVRDNLSVNDAWGGVKGVFTFSYGVPENTSIYNNTVYISSILPSKPIFCDGCDGSTPGTWSFRNNIVVNYGSGDYLYPNAAGAVFANNTFYGNHPANEPGGTNKLTSNPLLVSPSATAPYGIGSVSGYQIASGSPASGSGILITDNGGVDFFGRVVSASAAPSRGFHEVKTVTGPAKLIDTASNWMVISARTTNAKLDTSGPFSNFNGDASRYSRTNTSAGGVTWNFPGMTTFSATMYVFNENMNQLVFSRSSDGVTWTTVPTSYTTPVATTNGWTTTTVTPTAALPAGTQFLRASITTWPSWSMEIGAVTISK